MNFLNNHYFNLELLIKMTLLCKDQSFFLSSQAEVEDGLEVLLRSGKALNSVDVISFLIKTFPQATALKTTTPKTN